MRCNRNHYEQVDIDKENRKHYWRGYYAGIIVLTIVNIIVKYCIDGHFL